MHKLIRTKHGAHSLRIRSNNGNDTLLIRYLYARSSSSVATIWFDVCHRVETEQLPYCGRTYRMSCVRRTNARTDVTSKVGDHVKFDAASPCFLVYLCQHQNKKNVMSTIMKTIIFSSFPCIFAKYKSRKVHII